MVQTKTKVENNRKADYPIDPLFINRWSPRAFLEKEVPEEVLLSVFEAARWAPSGFNNQPWRFILARTKENLELFHSFILPGNLSWCKTAPALALIVSETETEQGPNPYHEFDAGTASGYLEIQAAKQGLSTHVMGGIDREKAREVLQIPEKFAIHSVIVIGYLGEKDTLPENLQEREQPNSRRPLNEILFEGKFNQTLIK
ncbi:nitroreductase family protein [Bacillus timonensis]|uniref:nitroreductase family protein n=1 Tax=Bacillus timonensis TaxID=1033734 RepID=UPI000288F25B|nr:nitroreductase family protein [Bacillus timonensis]